MTGTASLNGGEHAALPAEARALLTLARFLVGCAQTGELRSALRPCDSVDSLIDLARSEGMLGHLARVVLSDPDLTSEPALAERLAGLRRALLVRNMRQTAYLLQILDALEQDGVKAMPFKGPVWAEALYGDLASRNWTDLDLLIREDQLDAAHEALLAWGLKDVGLFNKRAMRTRWGSTGQIALAGPDHEMVLDLHWKTTVSTSPRSLVTEAVLARSEAVEVLEREVACPGKVDMLLMTCLEGTRDRWGTVMRLLDLATQVNRMAEGEWSGILQMAKEAGCERRVTIAVRHVCGVLGLQEPEAVTVALAHDRVGRSLERRLRLDGLAGRSLGPTRERIAQVLWGAGSEDRFMDSARHLAARLFAPTAEDWASYGLPGRLDVLYGLFRPARLAVKWTRHVFGAARRVDGGDRRTPSGP